MTTIAFLRVGRRAPTRSNGLPCGRSAMSSEPGCGWRSHHLAEMQSATHEVVSAALT
jgi:hypothetical protein